MFLISDFLFFIQKSTIPLLHFLAPYSAVLKYSFSTRLASAEYSESNPPSKFLQPEIRHKSPYPQSKARWTSPKYQTPY